MSASGTVLSLHRWPVKSMGGEPVQTFLLGRDGVAGDRAHIVYRAGRQLTARQAPRLLAWQAGYGDWDGHGHDLPSAVVTAPDGRRFDWADPELAPALADDLGRDVELRWNAHGEPDLRASVLVTTRATHEAIERELGRALDLRRWRTNIHVELDAAAFAEEHWEGRELTVGDARFDLLHPCARCVIPTRDPDTQEKAADLLRHLAREHGTLLGINARAHHAARVRVGDRVELAS